MPIYEYECQACGHQMEAMQRMSDDPLKDCPECHKPELKKLISASAFRLKGGGWYETDFKSKNQKNLSKSGESGSGDSKSGDSKSGETKSGGSESGSSKSSSDSGSSKSSSNNTAA